MKQFTKMKNASGIDESGTQPDRSPTQQSHMFRAATRYDCLYNSDVIGVFIASLTGEITEANDAFLHMVGYEQTDLPLRWDRMTPPEWQLVDQRKVEEAQALQHVSPFEKEYLHKNGTRVPVLIAGAMLDESRGDFFCMVLDRTIEKQAEETLRRLVSKPRTPAPILPDAAFRLDRNGVYLDFLPVPGFEPIAPPKVFLGKRLNEVLPTSVADLVTEKIAMALDTGSVQHLQYALDSDGIHYFDARIVPEGPDSVLAIVHDVTDREAAVSTLTRSERHFRDAYEHLPLMYFILDTDGVILSVNADGAAQLGYTPNELVGTPVLEVFHVDDRAEVVQQVEKLVQSPGLVGRWEFRKIKKDGTIIWVRESANVVIGAEGRPVVLVVCEDITERREADQRVLNQREQLRKLSSEVVLAEERERRKIARQLHDTVGQTLAFVRSKLGLCVESADDRQAIVDEVSDALDVTIAQVRSLTFELSPPMLENVGLSAAIQALGEQLAAHGGFRFHFVTPSIRKPLSKDLSMLLYRTARELLMNASKYSGASDVRVTVEKREGDVELVVSDNGCGFDASGATDGFSGSGTFGLFSIRQQLEYVGGQFHLTSEPGGGTNAFVRAPVREWSDETALPDEFRERAHSTGPS